MKLSEKEQAAQKYIVWLLSRREYSKKEILDKLVTRFPDDNFVHIANFCEKEGWISDKRFCECYIRDKALLSGWGRRKIQFQIARKGIDLDLFQSIFFDVLETEEILNTATKLATSKWKVLCQRAARKEWNFWDTKQKLFLFLASRGYEMNLIKQITDTVCVEESF